MKFWQLLFFALLAHAQSSPDIIADIENIPNLARWKIASHLSETDMGNLVEASRDWNADFNSLSAKADWLVMMRGKGSIKHIILQNSTNCQLVKNLVDRIQQRWPGLIDGGSNYRNDMIQLLAQSANHKTIECFKNAGVLNTNEVISIFKLSIANPSLHDTEIRFLLQKNRKMIAPRKHVAHDVDPEALVVNQLFLEAAKYNRVETMLLLRSYDARPRMNSDEPMRQAAIHGSIDAIDVLFSEMNVDYNPIYDASRAGTWTTVDVILQLFELDVQISLATDVLLECCQNGAPNIASNLLIMYFQSNSHHAIRQQCRQFVQERVLGNAQPVEESWQNLLNILNNTEE